jgi:hypothetical protein
MGSDPRVPNNAHLNRLRSEIINPHHRKICDIHDRCAGIHVTGNPARRPEAQDIQQRQTERDRQRPFRPPLAPIHDPYTEPDAEGCEPDGQGWKQDGHAAILPAVAWGREGRTGFWARELIVRVTHRNATHNLRGVRVVWARRRQLLDDRLIRRDDFGNRIYFLTLRT